MCLFRSLSVALFLSLSLPPVLYTRIDIFIFLPSPPPSPSPSLPSPLLPSSSFGQKRRKPTRQEAAPARSTSSRSFFGNDRTLNNRSGVNNVPYPSHRRVLPLWVRITPPVCSASRMMSKSPLGNTVDLFPLTERWNGFSGYFPRVVCCRGWWWWW